jgi:hypothetical protein
MVQITALQQLDGGHPGMRCLLDGFNHLWGDRGSAGGARGRRPGERPTGSCTRRRCCTSRRWFVIMAVFDPATHRSASMHQTYGPCHVEAIDIAGLKRFKYLCAEDFAEDFTFDCVDELPALYSEWYTVCGKAHTDKRAWLLGVGGLGLTGILVYSYLLGPLRRRRD